MIRVFRVTSHLTTSQRCAEDSIFEDWSLKCLLISRFIRTRWTVTLLEHFQISVGTIRFVARSFESLCQLVIPVWFGDFFIPIKKK